MSSRRRYLAILAAAVALCGLSAQQLELERLNRELYEQARRDRQGPRRQTVGQCYGDTPGAAGRTAQRHPSRRPHGGRAAARRGPARSIVSPGTTGTRGSRARSYT